MRTTRSRLEEIIKEEIQAVLKEMNPFHDEDGKFSNEGNAETYSLSDRAVAQNGVSKRYAARGVMTGAYSSSDPKSSIRTPSGSDSGRRAAGRQEQSGKAIKPRFSLSQHPATYSSLREAHDELAALTSSDSGFVSVPADTLDRVLQALAPYLADIEFSDEGEGSR